MTENPSRVEPKEAPAAQKDFKKSKSHFGERGLADNDLDLVQTETMSQR